jgi:tetratricopeptide (TPR) repeat protein
MHKKALKIWCRALGEDHVDVAMSLESIGFVYGDQGKHAEAVEVLDKALAIYDRALGIDSRHSARVHCNIAISKSKSGDIAGALESAKESVRIHTKLGVDDSTSQKAAEFLRELEDMG